MTDAVTSAVTPESAASGYYLCSTHRHGCGGGLGSLDAAKTLVFQAFIAITEPPTEHLRARDHGGTRQQDDEKPVLSQAFAGLLAGEFWTVPAPPNSISLIFYGKNA
jgi:hypothetical protein